MRRPIRQKARRISRWVLYQQKLNFIEKERRNRMKDPRENGATAVPAAVAPGAMKHNVRQSHAQLQDSRNRQKTTELFPLTKTYIIPSFSNLSLSESTTLIKRKSAHEVV